MSLGKRLLLGLLCVMALAIVGLIVFVKFYLSPIVKDLAEKKGTEALGTPVTIGALSISLVPPFKVHAQNVALTLLEPKTDILLPAVAVTADIDLDILDEQKPLGAFDVELEQPTILVDMTAPARPKAEPPAAQGGADNGLVPRPPRDLVLHLKIIQGKIKAILPPDPPAPVAGTAAAPTQKSAPRAPEEKPLPKEITLSPLDLSFDLPGWDANWKISTQTVVKALWNKIDATVPVAIDSEFSLKGHDFVTPRTTGAIGGLGFSAKGQQNLKAQTGQWEAVVAVPELKDLKVPPAFLPPGQWSGKIDARVKAFNRDGRNWLADGAATVTGLKGSLDLTRPEGSAKGALAADADLAFSYRGPQAIQISRAQMNVSLDQMALAYGQMFAKPADVPLNFQVAAAGDQNNVRLEKAQFKFAQLEASAQGAVSLAPGSRSDLTLQVARTSLAGWERFFPALAGSPVTGFVQLKGGLQGDLSKPENLSVELAPLLLEQVRGQVKWASPDKKQTVQGPAFVDARITLHAAGRDLKDANVTAKAMLSDLAVNWGELFTKRAGVPLKLDLQARKKGNQIEVKNSVVQVHSGVIRMDGRFEDPQRPKLALRVSSPGLQFRELAELLPMLKEYGLQGQVAPNVELSGMYDFAKGIEASPLKAKANIKVDIPQFAYKPAPTPQPTGKESAPAKAPPPQPLLPNWPVARTAEVVSQVNINRFMYDQLPVEGIQWSGVLRLGVLTGQVAVRKIFEGGVKVSGIKMNLAQAQPDVAANAAYTGLDANQAMTWLSKDWKDLVKGSASGQMQLLVPHPSRPDFMARLKAEGQAQLKNAFVSTLQLDQMANQALAKIPGVGDDKVHTKGVAADIAANFAWARNRLNLREFHFLTPEKNELKAQGHVDLEKNIDMEGTAYLATAPVKGTVRAANSDGSGRLVLPIRIKGNMLQPQAAFAEKTVETLLKNTAQHELKGAQKKAEARIKEEGKKEVQKKVDELKDKFKKDGLKGIFGK